MCEEALADLQVPEEHHEAFRELFDALSEKANGGNPPRRSLEAWQTTLQKARAVATVRQYAETQSDLIDEAVGRVQEANAVSAERLRLLIEQRLIFVGVYGKGSNGQVLTLEDALSKVEAEISLQLNSGPLASDGFVVRSGRFDERHGEVQRAAYPYRPSVSAGPGTPVLECVCASDDRTVAGYIAMQGDYVDDVAVHPRFHGRRVAKALVCAAAALLEGRGSRQMSLDARSCNFPAFEMYRSLGFNVDDKYYPSFFDWHGGYSLSGSTAEISAHLPSEGFEYSPLGIGVTEPGAARDAKRTRQ